MRKVAVGAVSLVAVFGLAPPAAALNSRPEPSEAQVQQEPSGAHVVSRVARTLFPLLPPNPCIRLPNLGLVDNPVLPPNPCLTDGRS